MQTKAQITCSAIPPSSAEPSPKQEGAGGLCYCHITGHIIVVHTAHQPPPPLYLNSDKTPDKNKSDTNVWTLKNR